MSGGVRGSIRRGHITGASGPGSIVVLRGGISVIVCGLDPWYRREDGAGSADTQEYMVEEWRLQERLGVGHFMLPPDYRDGFSGPNTPNTRLTLPVLKFPQWHFCPTCRRLEERPSSERGQARCMECAAQSKKRRMYQVRFLAMCDRGHIQDFPWREWVHRSVQPPCRLPLRLTSTGSASLTAEKVKCDCGAERSLGAIMSAALDGSTRLTNELDPERRYLCRGRRPWLGTDADEECDRPLYGVLRDASNNYFAQVVSAIYLPRLKDSVQQEVIELLEKPPLSTLLSMLSSFGREATPQDLRTIHQNLLHEYSDATVEAAIREVQPGRAVDYDEEDQRYGDDEEMAFRRAEYEALRTDRNDQLLKIRSTDMRLYDPDIARYFSRVMLIDKLRETKVFTGFTRLHPEGETSAYERRMMLWRNPPGDNIAWLPAHVVYGEGIFLELSENILQRWERQPEVMTRIDRVIGRYKQVQRDRRLAERPLGPRFVLLHTFAHLIINRLTFECGYSSASLHERLYISDNPEAPMAGVLIYTADGDSEGTMGGLVRMGRSGYLESVIRRALEGAMWCSSDPVCMELGEHGGQGPNSCNLAACHNCALVPETACEEFNRFLDRAVVISAPSGTVQGYFADFQDESDRTLPGDPEKTGMRQ